MSQARETRRENQPDGGEWIGGAVTLPGYVTGEGEPFRPRALLWVRADGAILGTSICRPGEELEIACESLQETIREPMLGEPHAPERIHVASAELASVLRAGHPGIEFVCRPTPELDALLAAMEAAMSKGGSGEFSSLAGGVEPAAMASFFRAAADLYRAAPWASVPSDQDLLSVSIAALDIRDAALCVIGQMTESHGTVLFDGLGGFEAFHAAVKNADLDAIPPHMSLNFDPRDALPDPLPDEVDEHGWELAAEDAYPWIMVTDEETVNRPAIEREITCAEAIARALVIAQADGLFAAFDGGDPASCTVSVPTHAGEVEVTLRAPYE